MMTKWRSWRSSVSVGIAVLGLVVGAAGVSMAVAGGDKPEPPKTASAAADRLMPAQQGLGTAGKEDKFVPVKPCRILDTRNAGGPLVTGTDRTFTASLTNYAGQGGAASDCGIPAYAVAVQLNLGAAAGVMPSAPAGWVAGRAAGTPATGTSLLNYSRGSDIANMVALPVSPTTTQFVLSAFGSVHVFADVAGYYTAPLYATIYKDGAIQVLYTSPALLSVTHTAGTGDYMLTFNRPVTGCAAAATDTYRSRLVNADTTVGTASQVAVRSINRQTGAGEDTWFHLLVMC